MDLGIIILSLCTSKVEEEKDLNIIFLYSLGDCVGGYCLINIGYLGMDTLWILCVWYDTDDIGYLGMGVVMM